MRASELSQPFSPEETGACVKLEGGTVRLGSAHPNLIMEDDLEKTEFMDPLVSKTGICRANPAPTYEEEKLATALYRETGPIVPKIHGRMHEGGYVRASQEEVKSSVFCFWEMIMTNWPAVQIKHFCPFQSSIPFPSLPILLETVFTFEPSR